MGQQVKREDIDDILGVLDTMMTRIDERFTKLEKSDQKTQKQIQNVLDNLDSFAKRQEISDDERRIKTRTCECCQ